MNEFEHKIDEIDSSVKEVPKNKLSSIWGMFTIVDTIPTSIPTNFENQIKIYINGATKRLYIYETINNVWVYTTLT